MICLFSMDTAALQNIGLSDSEIEVFLIVFELGECTVRQIVDKSGKHRTNVYDTLEKLSKKGLVSGVMKNKIKHFYMTNPYKLEEYFKEREKDFRKQEQNLHEFIVGLNKLSIKSKKKQNIEVFQGIDGLKALYYRLINVATLRDVVYIVGSVKKVFKILEYHLLDIGKKSAKINLKGRMIASEMIFKRKVTGLIKRFVDLDVRFIPREFLSPTAVIIFKDFVCYFNYIDEPFIVLIEDASIAKSYKDYFENMWKKAKV